MMMMLMMLMMLDEMERLSGRRGSNWPYGESRGERGIETVAMMEKGEGR